MVGGLTGSNGERASMANKHKKQQNYSCRAVMSAGEPGEAAPGSRWCTSYRHIDEVRAGG